MSCSRKLNLVWIDASNLEDEVQTKSPSDFYKAHHQLCGAQGILVPGGFGERGTEVDGSLYITFLGALFVDLCAVGYDSRYPVGP